MKPWYGHDRSKTGISGCDIQRDIYCPNLSWSSTRTTYNQIRRNPTRLPWLVTRVHNPVTGFFEVKRSPLPSPTVSPVPGLHGTSCDIKPSLSTSRTDHKLKQSTNTETPFITRSTPLKQSTSKTRQITYSTYHQSSAKTSKITLV